MSRIYCRSLYAFRGKHDQALKFEVGEIIEVLQPLDGGWWEGEIDGVRGWFPANYVNVLEVSQGHGSIYIRWIYKLDDLCVELMRKEKYDVCK